MLNAMASAVGACLRIGVTSLNGLARVVALTVPRAPKSRLQELEASALTFWPEAHVNKVEFREGSSAGSKTVPGEAHPHRVFASEAWFWVVVDSPVGTGHAVPLCGRSMISAGL